MTIQANFDGILVKFVRSLLNFYSILMNPNFDPYDKAVKRKQKQISNFLLKARRNMLYTIIL
jgi:hypothetical protein